MNKHALATALLCMGACATAHAAQDMSFYEGIGIATVNYDLHVTPAERYLPFTGADGQPVSQNTYSFDTSTGAYQLFGGFRINRNFAVELNLADLGTVHRDGTFAITNGGTLNGATLVSHTRFEAKGAGLSVLGIWPINPSIDLFGRIGAFDWSIKAPYTITVQGQPYQQAKPSDHGTDPFFGIGAAYKWNEFSVRLEYQRYTFSTPFTAVNDTDANLFGAAFLYNF